MCISFLAQCSQFAVPLMKNKNDVMTQNIIILYRCRRRETVCHISYALKEWSLVLANEKYTRYLA